MHSPFLKPSPMAGYPVALRSYEWPMWARVIARFKSPGDIGLGDTVTHLIGDANSERFKAWFSRKFGRSCGCTERRAFLNNKFKYNLTDSQVREQK